MQRWRKWEMTRVIYDNCLHVCDKKFLHSYYHQGYKVYDYVEFINNNNIKTCLNAGAFWMQNLHVYYLHFVLKNLKY